MKSALRLEMRGGTIETDNTFEVASIVIKKLNRKLEEAGWGINCIKYKSHHASGEKVFVLCAIAPSDLYDWVNQLPYCNAVISKGDELEFHLNIPIQNKPREISSETHQTVKGVIES